MEVALVGCLGAVLGLEGRSQRAGSAMETARKCWDRARGILKGLGLGRELREGLRCGWFSSIYGLD